MRNSIRAAVLSGAFFISVAAQVSGAMAGPGCVVVNTNDDVSIQQVYVANAGESDPWRPANMDHAIAPGTQSSFTVPGDACFYDVKVRFSEGAEQTFDNVDVCKGDRVVAS